MLLALAVYAVPKVLHWAFVDSLVVADAKACAAAAGACWAVIHHHARMILLDSIRTPSNGAPDSHSSWSRSRWRRPLRWACGGCAGSRRLGRDCELFIVLMAGGVFGLKPVPTDAWGGLPLASSFSSRPCCSDFRSPSCWRWVEDRGCRRAHRLHGAIEIVRAMPILTILFCAAIVVPLMLPGWLNPGKIYRVILAMAFFYACFQAEIIRGGLQGVPVARCRPR